MFTRLLGVMVAIVATVTLTTGTASASVPTIGDDTTDRVVSETTLVQEVNPDGSLTTLQTFNTNVSVAGAIQSVSGTGGTSSVGGCRTVRITNVGHSVLHFPVYKFWTQVKFCWHRDSKQIYNVAKDWGVWVSGTFHFDKIVHTNSGFYGWLGALYPQSGYFYNKQAQFTNVCPLPKVCFKTTHPLNKINVHSNGTWWFSKTGAG